MTTRQLSVDKAGNFKRSIDGILGAFASLRNRKTGENDPLRNALYNVGILLLLAVFLGVILILRPFIRPLLWGLLVAAALFPMKKRLAFTINKWIKKVEKEEKPIIVGIFLLPFTGLEKLGECITRFTLTHIKFILIGFSSLIALRIFVHYVPKEFFSLILGVIVWLHSIFGKIASTLSPSMIIVLVICYLITIKIMWNSSNSNTFVICGQGAWIFIIGYFCSYLGAFQIPAFLLIMAYGFAGLYCDEGSNSQILCKIKNSLKKEEKREERETTPEVNATPMSRLMKTKSHLSEIKSKMQLNVPHESKIDTTLESDWYFKILFYACTATVLFTHLWMVFLSFIPISFYAIKALCKALGLWNHIEFQFYQKTTKIREWIEPRKYALVPLCLPGVLQLNKKVRIVFCDKLKSYVDDISACIMIVVLIVAAISLSVFTFVQIYSEAITVAQLSGNLINRTLTMRPELVEQLPINMQNLNDVIDNAYQYGRGYIENYLDSSLNGTDTDQAIKLKTQIISLYDRLVQSYMDINNGHDTIGPRVTQQSVLDTLDEIINSSGGYSSIIAWAKGNLGAMKELSDAILGIVMTNLSLLFSVFTTFFGVLIGSGHAMLTWLFNSIIFFTTLYYLLQSSHDRYVIMNISTGNSGLGMRLAEALETSVSSVLIATLKISLFHGLFTWLTHTVFGAHVIYLPTFIASLLAAAPFLETYWCSIPAFLDLWLSQDRFYLGLLLVLVHFIVPPYFNVTIHSEIKGSGHPYLTALSIAGGIYLLGLEGAIVGPLLLCILIVLFDVTINSFSSPTPTTFTQQSSTDDSNALASPATDWEFTKRLNDSQQFDSTI